jgi:hypothetical protein
MNYSHILEIVLVNPPVDQREMILQEIHQIIDGKLITYSIHDMDITMQWIKQESQNVYYTDVGGILGDVAVQKHKDMLLVDVLLTLNKKYNRIFTRGQSVLAFRVTKPLTRKVVLL